jgi:hypothetical protein
MKNYTIDLFDKLSLTIDEQNWKSFTESLQQSKNVVSLKNLTDLVQKYFNYTLSRKDQEFIFETFRSQYDDKGQLIKSELAEKFVMLNRLDQARKSSRSRKVQEMINLEENNAHMLEAAKLKGLIQVDENFLVNMAIANVKGWKDFWSVVKKTDVD